MAGWLVDCLVGWLAGWLVGWLVGWWVGRSVSRLIGWLVGSLFYDDFSVTRLHSFDERKMNRKVCWQQAVAV
jgi:hypothetical protein